MDYLVMFVSLLVLPIIVKTIDKGYKATKKTELASDLKKVFDDE